MTTRTPLTSPPWSGSLPHHWGTKPLGYLVTLGGGATPSKDRSEFWSGDIPWVSPKDMKRWVIRDSEDHVSAAALAETSLTLLQPPVVLLVVRGMILVHTVPVALTATPVTINQDMKALLPGQEMVAQFLAYALRAAEPVLVAMAEESGHGTRCLRTELWQKLRLPVPPLSEQQAITEYLDRKTADLDSVIAKKERLIELLGQERHATISRVATRGVNAAAPLKQSGLPWLGDVPQHWRLVQLKFLARIQTGVTLGKTYDEPTDSYPYLRVANVQDGSLVLNEITEIAVPQSEANRSMLRAGDVLLTEGGDLDKLGRGAVWRGQIQNCLHQNHVFAVRPNPELLLPEFLAYQTKAQHGREYFTLTGQKTTNLASTNTTKVGAFPLPLPLLAEQQAICDHIDRETSRIDGLIEKNEKQIAKLREYRQTLISAVVTGKLAVAPQPTVVPKQVNAPQPAVPVAEPAKKPANAFFRRSVFAAEIIDRLHEEPTFGHVKFQKVFFVAEIIDRLHEEPTFGHVKFQKVFFVAQHHLQAGDFEENYHRQAAGPYDNKMIRSVDKQLAERKWFAARHTDDRYVYEKLGKAGGHRQYFDRYFGQQAQALGEVLALFRTMTTEQAEIVATLYAVWNDFLILGEPFDDDRIIDDVLNNWHQSKQKIGRDRWQKALGWMREKGLVPHGFGKPTRQGSSAATAGEADGPDDESGN